MNKIFLMLLLLLGTTTVSAVESTENDTVHGHALEGAMHLNEVVVTGVTGQSLLKNTPSAISVITPKELESVTSTNIIDAITTQPGVSQVTTGNGISKPVIRGMGYNRVLVVNDGIRQEGQQWGDEHGVEIDGSTVGSVEILKGPASLMYGSDALAGVIVFKPAPIMSMGTMKVGGLLEYQTNNGLYAYSLNFKGNQKGFVWNWRYSGKGAHAYKNKYDGYVFGSSYWEQALSGMTGINKRWGFSHLTLSYYHLKPGIIEGERDETTGELLGEDGCSYSIFLPYQQVYHYKAVSDNTFYIGDGSMKVLLGYQQNRRKEYEEDYVDYGLYFRLHTVNYDVRYLSPDMSGWKISTGVNGMYQKSENLGSEYLVPAYNLFDAGMFATTTKSFGRLNFSGGLRFDVRHLHSYSLYEDGEERFTDFSRNFNGLTGSVGITYELAKELDLKLNISRGFRAPNISELGSNGEHEGTLRYEIGNKDLKPEKSWQFDLGLDYSSAIFSAELALFANFVNDYIYSAKLANSDGSEILTEGLSTYGFMSGDARLLGGEILLDLHPLKKLHFENTLSYVNAQLLDQPEESKYLPLTPAPRWVSEAKYYIIKNSKGWLDNLFVKVGMDLNFEQNHYYAANNTETATPAYTLWNVQIGGDIMRKGSRFCSIYLTCENLTDKAYQNHLSRLKYCDVNTVTGRMGVYNMGRNFGIKIVFG